MNLTDIYLTLPPQARITALKAYGWWQAKNRFGDGFRRAYRDLLESQWLAPADLAALQANSLRRMIEHAYLHVPLYRTRMDEMGLKPGDIAGVDDLRRLPFLTRTDVANHLKELSADNAADYRPILTKTSGSTGQKLLFFLPRELKWSINTALLWRQYSWAGISVGAHRATLGARIFTIRPPYAVWNPWENQLLLSSHHLSEETMKVYVKMLRRHNIEFIQGHPSAVGTLARSVLEHNDRVPLRAVFTTGEHVYDEDRVAIEQAFACPLMDSYGMGESAVAAQQCAERFGYHESSEYTVIELVSFGEGLHEIVATSLYNWAMPFIRYRTGDIVQVADAAASCACGLGLPMKFRRVIGRTDDRLTFGQATVLPVTVRMFMKPLLEPGENYQVIQEADSGVRVLLTGSVNAARAERVHGQLSGILPAGTRVWVEHASEIRGHNNKIRNVVSRVAR